MQFDNIINTILNEEEVTKDDKLAALSKLTGKLDREFKVIYCEYQRHEIVQPVTYDVRGSTLGEALEQLPEHVFDDIFSSDPGFYEEEWEAMKQDDDEVIDYLNDIDVGGFSFLAVYEDNELIAGFEPDPEFYEEEGIDFDDPERQ